MVNIVNIIICRTIKTIVAPTQRTWSLFFIGLTATFGAEFIHVVLVAGGFVWMVSAGVVAVKATCVAVVAVWPVWIRLPIAAAASTTASAGFVAEGRDKLCLGGRQLTVGGG